MNKEIKLLWLDDEQDWVNTRKFGLERYLKGFSLKPIIHNEISVRDFSFDIDSLNQFDLILVDNSLFEEPSGGEFLKKIRDNKVLTDVLFYSTDFEKIKEYLTVNMSEDFCGIYLSERTNEKFDSKVISIINKIIRRSEGLTNFRGIVMDACSEFETIAEQKLNELHEKSTDLLKKEIINEVQKILNGHKDNAVESLRKIENNDTKLKKIIGSRSLSMNDRLQIFSSLAKKNGYIFKTSGNNDLCDYYMKKLGSYRNKLGHTKVGDKIIIDNNEIEINEDFFQNIRENILFLDNNFEKDLTSLIQSCNHSLK